MSMKVSSLVENVALSDGKYLRSMTEQKQVHFVCEDDVNQEEEDPQTEEVCYMSNQGRLLQRVKHNNNTNLSYRSTNLRILKIKCIHLNNQNQGGQQTVYFKRGYPPKVFGNQNQGYSAQAGSSSVKI
ncbi:unnamed protein product [Microthlaspi erraticum]|uniref:Uncharacterized protein n=1 Tax=Microthlaspi erraticum TaxID=1685480 RepID=A0A6D2HZT1_9BRAS|nr:unnamed protein product [Microthlaspi erraticum]